MNHELYLRRRQKIHIGGGHSQQSQATLATLLKNLDGLGYTLSLDAQQRASTLSVEELEAFYSNLMATLRQLLGAQVAWAPFYPDFPRQVMEMSEAELYLNALYHYLTNERIAYSKGKRPPLDEGPPEKLKRNLKVIGLGNVEDFESIFSSLVGAKTSISNTDKDDVRWFVRHYKDDIVRLLPDQIPSRETLAILGAAMLQHTTIGYSWVRSKITMATDVLRLAVALHDGDVSLAELSSAHRVDRAKEEAIFEAWMAQYVEQYPEASEWMQRTREYRHESKKAEVERLKFGKFSRLHRRLLLGLLEMCPNATEDMLRWRAPWVHLGEKLHPGEWAKRYPQTFAAFEVVRGNKSFVTFNSGVEQSLRNNDLEKSLSLLRTRPGDFARRLDHLLRLYPADANSVLEAFTTVASKVSTPVLVQVLTHFKHRALPHQLRIFFPKGEVAKVWGETDVLPPLAQSLCDTITSRLTAILTHRFAALPPLGACYLDERLKDYLVPFSQRSASRSLRTLGRGSRLSLPETNTIRFFLWWKNGRERTDIDLSAAFYDADFVYKDVISYYNLKNYGGHHSGDIVNAPTGAAEFIDIDCARTREMGVRYVILCVNSYTLQPYCDLPECFTGWMARQKPNSGEIFEPRTVQDRIDLSARTSICLPLVIDLGSKNVVWMDLALRDSPAWNNVANNLKGVSLMLRAMLNLEKTTLYDLFELHVAARGSRVDSKEEALQIFSLEQGLTPFDLDVITSQWL